ncbi:MAG: hypothetical protein Q8R92_10140 [Deltaproteobacteria bacterium]|nr:hypothetical protein [Deltaproteobacteria bacterium]
MATEEKVGTDLTLDEALDGWSNRARYCFESLKEAVRISGAEWTGIISAFGRQPVPILNFGDKNVCQVYPDGDRVVIQIIRGEDVLEAVKKDRKLPAHMKRAFSAPGKLNFLAELPVTGVADARAVSSILTIKAACLGARTTTGKAFKRPARKSAAHRKSL